MKERTIANCWDEMEMVDIPAPERRPQVSSRDKRPHKEYSYGNCNSAAAD